MTLIHHNIKKLEEIKDLFRQLPSQVYSRPNEILSKATIGQHFRHILEFYICLERGSQAGTICYDDRDRDQLIETNMDYAIHNIEEVIGFLRRVHHDRLLTMMGNYAVESDDKTTLQTSLYRELAYALDHTVHHLAIVKIALSSENIEVDNNFGVAPSTTRHRKVCVQ